MRSTMLGVAALALAVCGCVTVSPQPPSLAPTPTPAPRLAPIPTLPPIAALSPAATASAGASPPATLPCPCPSAVTTITVSFDRGPNAGSYTVSADPACSYGVIAKGTWAMQYGNFGAGPNDLSTVQLQISPDSSGKAGTDYIVSAFIVVGAIVGGTDYTLSLDRFTHGVNKVDVVDQGGVLIDIGVFCPSVNRG